MTIVTIVTTNYQLLTGSCPYHLYCTIPSMSPPQLLLSPSPLVNHCYHCHFVMTTYHQHCHTIITNQPLLLSRVEEGEIDMSHELSIFLKCV